MYDKVYETINELCDWIKAELKDASSMQTESILPAVIEATAKLVESNRFLEVRKEKDENREP